MSDKRRSRRAKDARRDARRAKKRDEVRAVDTTLTDVLGSALKAGHPVHLLSLASYAIHMTKPDPLAFLKGGRRETASLDRIVTGLISASNREATALLAVITELLVDEPESQLRCRQELAQLNEQLPRWISALPQIDVYRAVRRAHVLGDVDEIVVGARLGGGHELTVAVRLNHNEFSTIVDAGVVPDPIDEALARVAQTSRDTDVVEMALADVRAWIEGALAKPTFAPETDSWPFYRALVQWLATRLPEGGERRSAATDWHAAEELCHRFFASDCAAPFTEVVHRELLLELFESGSGDPLRWSAQRLEQVVGDPSYSDDFRIPLEVALDAPDLLRAFIPFAHAQSGIRDELTSQALSVVDELRSSYKREVLKQAQECWGYHDAV